MTITGHFLVDKAVDHLEQLLDVLEMQTGGGLCVKDVNGAAGGTLLQFGGQFYTLGLTTDRVGGLLEPHIRARRRRVRRYRWIEVTGSKRSPASLDRHVEGPRDGLCPCAPQAVSRLYRHRHTSRGTYTSGRKFISI